MKMSSPYRRVISILSILVTVGVIWDSDHPSAKYISSFMDCIGENLYLVDVSCYFFGTGVLTKNDANNSSLFLFTV